MNGVQRFLLRAPRHGATASGNEMVELPKVLYDAMLAVAQAASDHTSTYLGETRSPGQWELEVHRTRLAMFESIRILGEVNG